MGRVSPPGGGVRRDSGGAGAEGCRPAELQEFRQQAKLCRFELALKECALDRLRDACTDAIKGDKHAFVLGMASQAMGAHCARDTKELYRIQKVLTAKRSSPLLQVKDRGGVLIAGPAMAAKRRAEHFRGGSSQASQRACGSSSPAQLLAMSPSWPTSLPWARSAK